MSGNGTDSFTDTQRDVISNQLERMLANPLFRHSKRYPALLRYLVEQTLEGGASELKERTLGIAVFGRKPDYDTNADPVVRTTAGEIRRRIAQYYHEPGHEHELRIELEPGSYVPEFRPPAEEIPVPPRPARVGRMAAFAAVLLVLAGCIVAVLVRWPWTALDRFWQPIVSSQNSVLICVGQRQFLGSNPESAQQPTFDLPHPITPSQEASGGATLFQLYYLGSQNIALHDVLTLGRLAGLLQAHGKEFQIRSQSSTNFTDLRSGSVILVGALNNDWTMRLAGQMRFNFDRKGSIYSIVDQKNPAGRGWTVDYSMPYRRLTQDYALISRVLDPTTERVVVFVGGLTGFGTISAGEFLSSQAHMQELARRLPADWGSRNLQVVIATKVIDGISGPPRLVDCHLW
ncbi:MAG: hypothetical protein HY821_21070 [Acidobacteria bacterium]|nr:hypothetical protein [Acidobacteriota bacterium]